ncbi:MAG: ferredoxin family protein [Chloroflexi bacterium]|nr:ferredoxin family protein [Chloroflexota bacterium]
MPIKIDKYACTGCQVCAWICPGNIIEIEAETKKAVAAHNRDCPSCGLCQERCPFGCIEVIRRSARSGSETFPMKNYLAGLGIKL